MELKTGDKIRIFKETDIKAYMDFIRYNEGFNVKREGAYIVVGEPYKYGGHISYGKQIRQARRDLGMKRTELAEKCGVSPKTVYEWEVGIHIPKNWKKVQRILKIGEKQ